MSMDIATALPVRQARVRERMGDLGVGALLLSLGADLPWLSGYEAMPLERLTMLVLPADGEATLVVPLLEAPRVVERPELFSLRPWGETENPVGIVADLLGASLGSGLLAISDGARAATVLALQSRLPAARFVTSSAVTSALRAVKDASEIAALTAAAHAADSVAAELLSGGIALIGRSEAEVSSEIAARLREAGNSRVNFSIVASGPNGASPHHEPGRRVIGPGELVVCDFGGTLFVGDGPGYCSDITRTVATGKLPPDMVHAYAAVLEAQEAGFAAAVPGRTYESVDAASRGVLQEAGLGEQFIHRLGHGIGIEGHEDPYLVEGNKEMVVAGNCFSVEPGVYHAGHFGVRIEDIVVATDGGPVRLNDAERSLEVVEA